MSSPLRFLAWCRRKRAALLGCAIVVGTLIGALGYAVSLVPAGFMETSTWFAAKVAASAVFVSGRSLDSVYERPTECWSGRSVCFCRP